MGRGLSPLQRTILEMAYENAGRRAPQTDVLYAEVLTEYFGWDNPSGRWSNAFSPKSIGENAYNSGKVSVSRAFTRLEQRGLIEKNRSMRAGGWHGAIITERGSEVVREREG